MYDRRNMMVWLAAGALALAAAVVGCDDNGSDPDVVAGDIASGDTGADPDVVTGDDVGTDSGNQEDATTPPQPFACGETLTCQPTEACQGQWPGACAGPAPGPDGCGPNCQPTDCAGGTVCICQSFECAALPADCSDCGCATDALPEWAEPACTCTKDAEGAIRFECMGA